MASRDHPRMGGEKNNELLFREVIRGSPPRGRGKDFMFCGQHLEIRITPAWRGKAFRVGLAGRILGITPA